MKKVSSIIQIASIPEREKMLRETVYSLRYQADEIFVAFNNYDHIPDFLGRNECIQLNNLTGDAAKFYDISLREGYILTCDDDLIYPLDYVEYMISGVYKYKCPCTLHGKTYTIPVIAFNQILNNYQCLSDVKGDGRVDIGGTGCMCWHSDYLKIKYSDFKSKNMADLWFAKICHEQNVKIMCLDHRKGYLNYQGPVTTIWDEEKAKGFIEQTKLLKTFL